MKKLLALFLACAFVSASFAATPAEIQAEKKRRKIAAKQAAAAQASANSGKPNKLYVAPKKNPDAKPVVTTVDIAALPLGAKPEGWRDDSTPSVNPNWVRDNHGFLRVANKGVVGYLILPAQLVDATLTATFKKSTDADTYFGIVARYQNPENYYAARFSADDRLAIVRVENGTEEILAKLPAFNRIREDQTWTLSFGTTDNIFTAIVRSETGIEQARLDWIVETDFPETGAIGLNCTPYAATDKLTLTTSAAVVPEKTPAALAKPASVVLTPVPLDKVESCNTPFAQLAANYDVIVAGAGTGGWAAAIQAARLGAKVLLVEESNWIGGQMSAAAVTSMDEQGCWDKFPVRERGLYKEFHESITNYYYSHNKDPFRAYYSWPVQQEGGYEPKVSRAVLYAFIEDARAKGRTLDVTTDTLVTAVNKNNNRVTGVTLTRGDTKQTKNITCKVLVEATEYGDILPLAKTPYRIGSSTSERLAAFSPADKETYQKAWRIFELLCAADKYTFGKVTENTDKLAAGDKTALANLQKLIVTLKKNGDTELAQLLTEATPATYDAILKSSVQFHTWLGVIREYPEGLPEHLRVKQPPPKYNANTYKNSKLYGRLIWGGIGKGYKGPRTYRVLLAWRGMADIDSPMTGTATETRHTQCGLNGGYQDYPVNINSVENPDARLVAERDGIYRTLGIIYYLQNELGLNWGPAEDEGYNTPYNQRMMAARNLRPDLYEIAKYLPNHPYVRECRRAIGIYTLRTADMGRFENAKHFHNSVAMGDYFMDIDHGKTATAIETDLDPERPVREGGPFQIPFEAFIPKTTDGLVLAEKNISQSRIVNGATRLQPSTLLIGQAAGAIAAQAALGNTNPRDLNPIAIQATLLATGDNLIQRWYEDIPHGSPLWQATQLLSLHKVIDLPAPFNKDKHKAIGHGNRFSPRQVADAAFIVPALKQLAQLSGKTPDIRLPRSNLFTWQNLAPALTHLDPAWQKTAHVDFTNTAPVTRADFALVAATILKNTARPALLKD